MDFEYDIFTYERLKALGTTYSDDFDASKKKDDIDRAIDLYERAGDITLRTDIFDHALLGSLAVCYSERFEAFGQMGDINRAIALQRDILDRIPEDDSYRGTYFSNLGMALGRRYETTGETNDLEEAIYVQERALELTHEGDENFPAMLMNLATSLQARCDHSDDINDIENGVLMGRRAIQLTQAGHVHMTKWLCNLGNLLIKRFDRMGNPVDLDEVIDARRRAVSLTPQGHPDLPSRLDGLSYFLRKRYRVRADPEDLTEAISIQRSAVDQTPEDHTLFPKHVDGLANALIDDFEMSQNSKTLDQAINILERTLELKVNNEAMVVDMITHTLGNLYFLRFEHSGYMGDIEEAINLYRKAVALGSKTGAELAASLNNLGSALQLCFEHTGNLRDIEEAISVRQHAIRLTPHGNINMPRSLSNLAVSFYHRFERTSDLCDIQEAISLQKDALGLLSDGANDFSGHLNNLSLLYLSLYNYIGNVDVLVEAISTARRSIAESNAHDKVQLSGKWGNLGNMLRYYFEETGNIETIEESILALEKAVQLIQSSNPTYPVTLNNLANSYQRQFDFFQDVRHIEKAIYLRRKAIGAAPLGHTQFPMWLNNLGYSYLTLSRHSQSSVYLNEAISSFRTSAELTSGPARDRMTGALEWANLCYGFDYLKEMCLRAYGVAFKLLPQIAWIGFDVNGRQRQLKMLSNLSHSAAAAAISMGKYETALEWLEQGRGVIWNQLNNLRTPLDELREINTHLADEILRVSRQLELSGNEKEKRAQTFEEKVHAQEQTIRQQELAHEWDFLLGQAREVPGFSDFLRPVKLCDFTSGMKEPGYVVIVNMDNVRCDALALRHGKGHIIHIPLPNISYSHAQRLSRLLNKQLRLNGIRMREVRSGRPLQLGIDEMSMEDILSELWARIVKPIVDVLQFKPSLDEPTRIWWCPVGPLAFLPIHAAGNYGKRNTGLGSVLSDYAISSYTPTISMMVKKAERCREQQFNGILIISQSNTMDLPSIPGATRECEDLQKLFESKGYKSQYLGEQAANVISVSQAIDSYSWVHLACHACQDDGDPTHSSFFLKDGKLDLATISKKQLPHADFAFLSACQTSTGDASLAEEAVHLAAGMFTAGYRNVIATMWSIQDEHAPKIANKVYSHLLENGASLSNGLPYPNSSRAAKALHLATREIRRDLGDDELSYLAWVPYVHIGL